MIKKIKSKCPKVLIKIIKYLIRIFKRIIFLKDIQYIFDYIYLSHSKKNYVVYTCITGNYDRLLPIWIKDKNTDYVCYTDNIVVKHNGWKLKKIPKDLKQYSPNIQNRIIKLRPYIYFKEYKLSIYIDGNIIPNCNITDFVTKLNFDYSFIYLNKHPYRRCLYEEARKVKEFKLASEKDINKQLNKYRKEGFPENYGLTENNIILRVHNNKKCAILMETWLKELFTETKRDQLSFMYSVWKTKTTLGNLKITPRSGNLSEPFVLALGHTSKKRILVCNTLKENEITDIKYVKI